MRTLRGEFVHGEIFSIQDHFPVFNRQACVAARLASVYAHRNAIKFVGESITSSEISGNPFT